MVRESKAAKRRISMCVPAKLRVLVSILLVIAMVFPAFGQQLSSQASKSNASSAAPSPGAAQKLPLRRVILYKSGVGYFEHAGQVHGNENVDIDLTSSQLDDVLKSLTALDMNGGRIVGANYNSQDPAGHQLESLPVAISDKPKLGELLEELRGAKLEVRNASGAFTGRLMSVEEKEVEGKQSGDDNSRTGQEQVSLLGDNGELRTFTLTPSTSLRFLDHDLEQQLARALGLMDTAHQEDTRHLVLTTTGSGERELRVSYISEVPVWKTTYRLVLPSDASHKPLLQGWAIVDNTVGEDWNNVELSLAAGAPQSFVQELSQPLYSRRPVVPLPEGAQTTPQMHAEALEGGNGVATRGQLPGFSQVNTNNNGLGTAASSDTMVMNGSTAAGGVGDGPERGGRGGGAPWGMQNLNRARQINSEDTGAAFMADDSEFNIFDIAAAAESINAAQGGSLGDLFEYKMKDRVTIHKNQSALVPIVQAEVKAEKVALWNAGMGSPRPRTALWLTNTSDEVLDGGSFSVVDGGAFAGEGLVATIQPGERRLMSYAADLGMQVVAKGESAPQKLTRIVVARGVMFRKVLSRQTTTYTIHNEETQARTMILEHPVRNGWKLAEDLKPEEKSAAAYRFRVEVPSKGTQTFVVEETSPTTMQVRLDNFNENTLEMYVNQKELTPELEQALRQILAQKDAIAKLDADIKQRQADVSQVFQDQERLRENMKALKGSVEEKALLQRYMGELNDEETQLAASRKEITELEAKRKQEQSVLDASIANMAFDVKM
jgi:hypothetical protein